MKDNLKEIQQLATRIRLHSIRMIHTAKSSHLGSNFSMAEIMAVLYGKILQISPQTVDDPQRDRLVLSKGMPLQDIMLPLLNVVFFLLSG